MEKKILIDDIEAKLWADAYADALRAHPEDIAHCPPSYLPLARLPLCQMIADRCVESFRRRRTYLLCARCKHPMSDHFSGQPHRCHNKTPFDKDFSEVMRSCTCQGFDPGGEMKSGA